MRRHLSPIAFLAITLFLAVGDVQAHALFANAGVITFIAEAGQPSQGPDKGLASPGSSIAIFDFFNLSDNQEFDSWKALWGRGLRRAAFSKNQITVIPYPRIHAALEELQIDPYYIAPEQVPALGKKLEADLVILGSFTVSEGVIAASLKVVDAKTGRPLKEETRFGKQDKSKDFLGDLTAALAKMLFGDEKADAKPEQAPPAEKPASPPPPTPAPIVPTPTPVPPPNTGPAPSGTSKGPGLTGAEVQSQPIGGPPKPAIGTSPTGSPPVAGTSQIQGALDRAWQKGQPPRPETAPLPSGPPPQQSPWNFPPTPAPRAPSQVEETIVNPIEAEIPSLHHPGAVSPQQVQSPFQPMPVLPVAPPPHMPRSSVSPQFAPTGPTGQRIAPPPSGGATFGSAPIAQPAPTPEPQQGPIRRFFSFVTRPFRPISPPPPQPEPLQQPMASAQGSAQQLEPAPTPQPSGNFVTRFFGRIFGRGQ
jgi:TolB-like protein